MFRRRSSSRHQPLNTTPSASAQSAASYAFLVHRDSSPSLSSAAAAAALRSHTPTPTSVENVQTKRMLHRQSSTASRARQPALHRSSSSGSMTSRTFRDQSPGRPKTSAGEPTAPPIPPIPQGLPNRVGSDRRSASLQPTTRVMSPPTVRASGRGGSLDRRASGAASPPSQRGPGPGGPNSVESDRPGSRTSINFSYPILARANSPRQSPILSESPRGQRSEQPSTRPLSPEETADILYSVSNTASQKVKTKPKNVAPGSSEGSHLASKTTGSRPTGTAVETGPDIASPIQEEAAVTTQLTPSRVTSNIETAYHDSPLHVHQRNESALDSSEESTDEDDGVTQTTPVWPRPKKRPSTVMEDHEGEERAEAAQSPGDDSGRAPHIQVSTASKSREICSDDTAIRGPLIVKPTPMDRRDESPARQSPSSSTPSSPSADRLSAEHRAGRQPSISPNRSARFSAQLTVAGPGAPIHEPPPRSMSPAKPALKYSSSPDRRVNTGLRAAQAPSEISDGTSVASDDGSRSGSRKKSAKVSFDVEAEIVGVAASPPTSPDSLVGPPSPEKNKIRTNWFAFGKKKNMPKELTGDDDFDSVLKPRPALPSFGSIRGNRDVGEEEPVIDTVSDNESTVSSIGNVEILGTSVSSDHAIGSILVNARKELSNHFRARSNESLPPEVTSVEGTGQVSDLEESPSINEEVGSHSLPTVQGEPQPHDNSLPNSTLPNTLKSPAPELVTEVTPKDQSSEPIPVISIQPATPGLEDNRQSFELQRMPGGFPPSTSGRATNQSTATNGDTVNVVQSSSNGVETTAPSKPTPEETSDSEDESGDSIYSDAAEDPAELEGDGFGSINAIVDSPMPVTIGLSAQAPESPARLHAQNFTEDTVTEPRAPSQNDLPVSRVPISLQPEIKESTSQTMNSIPEEHKVSQLSKKSTRDEGVNQSSSFTSPYPPWPLKSNSPPPVRAPADSNVKKTRYTSTIPYEGSHLRRALGGSENRSTDFRNRNSLPTMPQKRSMSSGFPSHTNVAGGTREQRTSKTLQPSAVLPSTGNLRRTGSNESNSSFKRSRASSRSDSQFAMKRTLRGARVDSFSTAESSAGRPNSPRAPSIRTTLRGPRSSERPSSLARLGKGTRSRPKTSSTISSSFKSRFADSDDEADREYPRRFSSRLADSSDEDEPLSRLRPVRGIPRQRGAHDGDSTDLDDSSDEEASRIARPGGDRGKSSHLQSGLQTTQDEVERYLSQPKKRGLLARLTSKKSQAKDGKVRKSDLDSAARRGTPLERSRSELEHMRGDGHLVNGSGHYTITSVMSNARPTSPKLHKRHTGEPSHETSWPLQSAKPSAEISQDVIGGTTQTSSSRDVPDRPSTSDGIVHHDHVNGVRAEPVQEVISWSARLRPKLRERADTNNSIASGTASDVVVGRTGRKKRFPLLRKAFGLRD